MIMTPEEELLSRIEAAASEMDAHEAERHARYQAEDDATAATRQREEDLHAEGVKARVDMKSALEAAIAKRKLEEVAMSPDNIAALMARIAHLEAVQKAAEEAAAA